MSVNADCYFGEVGPGRWKYAFQKWPYGETEEYDVHTGFASFGEAREHMDSMYPNPGGWGVSTHKEHIHEFEHDSWDDVTSCQSCNATKT